MLGIRWPLTAMALLAFDGVANAQAPNYVRTRDVIYGRKAGMALTMDVFTPKKGANRIAVIAVASSGWVSGTDLIQPIFYQEFLKRGYTVFAVVHGSQPTFTVPDIIEDMHRAVRFIRYNAKTYHIDPKRLGILGASSGGHLALMQGSAGDDGNPKADDLVERVSSRVQAVACFYAPTDFLNYGKPGNAMIDRDLKPPFTAAVDYKEFDKRKAMYVPITDEKRLREITRKISPITHVDAVSAPTLFFHGDKDETVPLQQSQTMLDRLEKAGVPAELIVWKGFGHGNVLKVYKDLPKVADWFDTHLVKKEGTK